MTAEEIQTLINRLLLLVKQLGWDVVKTDSSGPDIIVELRRPKK